MILVYFLFLIVITTVNCTDLSPDSIKLYHDINSGRGLYSNFPKITSLNVTTFKTEIFNGSTPKNWVVEFYNSWCGHCHRFSPIWKKFTIDIYAWRDLVAVGAVDCSNQLNTPLCREYEVMYYPTVKFFPRLSSESFLGILMDQRTVENLRHAVVDFVRTQREVDLAPFESNLQDLWRSSNVDNALVVVEDNSSFTGSELALDLHKETNLKVVSVFPSNEAMVDGLDVSSLPAIYLLQKSGSSELIPIAEFTRYEILKSIGDVLKPKGFSIPPPPDYKEVVEEPVDIPQAVALLHLEEQIKKKLHANDLSDTVFQVDIEGALRQSFFIEISSHKNINGESLSALRDYIHVLIQFFPIGKRGLAFLRCVKTKVEGKTDVPGQAFYNISKECEQENHPVFIDTKQQWLACRGSRPHMRGYPCSLWTMFHTLTAHADLKRAEDPRQVLTAMTGYIKHFFGCTDCSQHFQQMAVTMAGNVSSTQESMLWLWKAHNNVNNRLKGDSTEDPMHPKVQFPPSSICRNCSVDGIWNEDKVFQFLQRMYTNISYVSIEDVDQTTTTLASVAKSLRHEVIADEKIVTYSKLDNLTNHVFLWDFNLFDVSLCVILYLISMAIIILVCIKFYKKTYRKKHYLYDGFQKV